jgi:uncharacterized 2Fe-2S/4Fe-4S cluster protein (DUF4445 family)
LLFQKKTLLDAIRRQDSEVILQKWDAHFSPKGLAIDVGTTTLVVTLFCLATGKELSTSSSINPQTKFGHDV